MLYSQHNYIVLWQALKTVNGTCSEPVFQAAPLTCPGQTAVFSCKCHDESDQYRSVWDVSETPSPTGGCPLLHYLWPDTSVICGSFTGRSTGESPDSCYHTELSVIATLALNGTSVFCYFADGGPLDTRGNATLQVIGIAIILHHVSGSGIKVRSIISLSYKIL